MSGSMDQDNEREVVHYGVNGMLLQFALWTAGWTVLFYILTSTSDRWMKTLPTSTKAHENNKYWCARNVIGAIHALFIALISVPVFLFLCTKPSPWQFAASRHVDFCKYDEFTNLPEVEGIAFVYEAIALGGLAFTAFTLADVGISVLHRLASWDYIVHHVAFISAGLIIRMNCMLPFNAAMLLAMEVSTPSLNYLLFFRHRGAEYEKAVVNNGVVFVLLYLVFRLGINTYGFVLLCVHNFNAVPSGVAKWQAWFLLVAVGAGVAVQWFWFPGICRTFGAGLGIWSKPRPSSASDDEGESSDTAENGQALCCGMATGENEESDVDNSVGTELMSAPAERERP